jgi:stage II sporulation protein D
VSNIKFRILKRILLLLLVITTQLHAATVDVRILTTKIIQSFIFSPSIGNYKIYGDDALLTDSDVSGIFQLTLEGDSIILKTFEKTIGKYASIKMIAQQADAVFKIKSVIPESKVRSYEESITVSLTADKKQFLIVNNIDIEKYVGGVVESESGTVAALEYYKIQSILCRTYLLAHLNRHLIEGFNVCDDVHCQAYLNKANNEKVKKAIIATKGLVVVDDDLNLITAAFHSNCGGQTVASEDVWSMPTSYLKSVRDTFCLRSTHATWKRSIPVEDWKIYLQLKHKYPIEDSIKCKDAMCFTQSNGRAIFFTDKDLKIPLKTIRADFQLKSTYFSVEQQGTSVIFKGKGYGHGVGLCQEGAMRMAQLNYPYKTILEFYYQNVHLIDLSQLSFFKQE